MRTWQQRLATVALSLIVVGIFLPWELAGDFMPYRTRGVQLSPRLADNGGFAVFVCAALSGWAMARRPNDWRSASLLLRPLAVLIFVLLVLQFADVLRHNSEFGGAIGAPVPDVGLYLATASSMGLIVVAFIGAGRVAA